MKILGVLGTILRKMFSPIKANALFFIFMYLLGCLCAWTTLPNTKNAEIYENLYLELFFDLFILCAILLAFPLKIRRWVKNDFVCAALCCGISRRVLFRKF